MNIIYIKRDIITPALKEGTFLSKPIAQNRQPMLSNIYGALGHILLDTESLYIEVRPNDIHAGIRFISDLGMSFYGIPFICYSGEVNELPMMTFVSAKSEFIVLRGVMQTGGKWWPTQMVDLNQHEPGVIERGIMKYHPERKYKFFCITNNGLERMLE